MFQMTKLSQLLTRDRVAKQWESQEADSPRAPEAVSLTIPGSAVLGWKRIGRPLCHIPLESVSTTRATEVCLASTGTNRAAAVASQARVNKRDREPVTV